MINSAPFDELQKAGRDIAELRLVLQTLIGQAVHRHRARLDLALGIEVAMKAPQRHLAPLQFDRRQLDDAMALLRVQPGRFGIHHDSSHNFCPF